MTTRNLCAFRSFLLLTTGSASLWASLLCSNANATSIHIASQPMAQALETLGRQTGENIVFTPEQVANLKAPAVNGNMTSSEAIKRLLNRTGLSVETVPNGGFIIHPAPTVPKKNGTENLHLRSRPEEWDQ